MRTTKLGATTRKAVGAAGLAVFGAGLALALVTGTADASSSHQGHTNTGGMYGDPAAAAPYWRDQSLDDCALMASADVIGQLIKREVSEREIITTAQGLPSQSHPGPIYTLPKDMSDPNHTGYGTNPQDIPVLLARYGINSVVTSEHDADMSGVSTGMEALEHYLAAGRKVIVGVNAELIWGMPVQTRDNSGAAEADHAVVVTGVDTASGKVHLNDSGNPNGRDETISIEVFVRSWATSGDQMVVTQAAN
jgi:uncharacterized protein YvpB